MHNRVVTQVLRWLQSASPEYGLTVCRVKNKFHYAHDSVGGYRDILVRSAFLIIICTDCCVLKYLCVHISK